MVHDHLVNTLSDFATVAVMDVQNLRPMIALLAPEVRDQIAAGEVVERLISRL